MLKKNLVSFEPTTFTPKLTLFIPKTNSHSNRFFFELDSNPLKSLLNHLVGKVVEWLKRRAYDQHGLGSKPTHTFCCVLGKDTLRLSPAWWSWQAVLNFCDISIKLQADSNTVSWHLRKQVGVIAYPMY